MLHSREFPAWLLGLLIAAGCATAESDDTPSNHSNGNHSSGNGGSNASAGSAGAKAGTTGGSNPSSSAGTGGAAKAGTSAGGNAQSGTGTAGSAEGGSDDEGGTGQGGAGSGGKAGAAGGGSGGTSAGAGQGGKAGSGGTAGGGNGGSGGGGTLPSCDNPLQVLCDDFEDGNANGWTTSGGTWAVVQSGSYVYKGASGGYLSVAGDTAWTDQVVEATLKGVSFGGSGSSYRVGIVARRSSTSNFYTAVLDAAGDLRILKGSSSPSGSSGTCDAIPVSPGATFKLRLEVTGAAGNVHIKSFLDGTQVHDCTTTSGTLASGNAGVYSYGSKSLAEFDDFSVSLP